MRLVSKTTDSEIPPITTFTFDVGLSRVGRFIGAIKQALLPHDVLIASGVKDQVVSISVRQVPLVVELLRKAPQPELGTLAGLMERE